MRTLPVSDMALLVRTSFTNDDGWRSVRRQLDPETDPAHGANVEKVDDVQWNDMTASDLAAAHPDPEDRFAVMYVVDERAITEPGHPVLVVRVNSDEDVPFRCRAKFLAEVDANLTMANLDWDDFRAHLDDRGVYAGMQEDDAGATADLAEPTDVETAAQTSAARVRADLRQMASARRLTGTVGTVSLKHVYATTARKLFDAFGRMDAWLGTAGAGSAPGEDPNGGPGGFRSEGCLVANAKRGTVEGDYVDFHRPAFLTSTWVWNVRRRVGAAGMTETVPFLPNPTVVRVEFAEHRARNSFRTTLTLAHSGLPVEWLDDMRAFWAWTLQELPNRWRL